MMLYLLHQKRGAFVMKGKKMLLDYDMIVEDSAGHLFAVKDAPGIDHAWMGVAVKRKNGGYAMKACKKVVLVRKACTTLHGMIKL